MTMIVTAAELDARRVVARGELAPLAEGLRRELTQLLEALPEVPREKALLSRHGGRCEVDASFLRFDPYDPRHICPTCGRQYASEWHDRFRLYWYQMWLAERVLHAALLGTLTGDAPCRSAAILLLDRYAEQYLSYPNTDNVLGPSRPFFSTYLESIWLLQLTIALDILETGAPSPELTSVGARMRDRLIAPSASLIASYDEGMSNRQVWNNAALMAASRMLDDPTPFDRALHGPSGLHAHMGNALLSDGSWYEGENYHLFAHRGLWYGARIANAAGHLLPVSLDNRYREGFIAPFRTILPDLTYPSRRDSQYAVSIRQPRFAESCELGLAHYYDERIMGILARLYDPTIPRGDTGRAASTADVEQNLPATGLSRSDLSWRSLLCALPTLPPLVAQPLRSDLLPAQGLGVLRRDEGAVYVSLDYGHSGGGHGHPDRLNLTLVDRARRWFDDPGTGSYVDPRLHWYRSTLAHNAPLIDGHSQPRVHGSLLTFSDDERTGWISAQAELAPGVIVRRSVVVLDGYLVDEIHWEGAEAHEITLPMHGVDVVGARARSPSPVAGGTDAEDGFAFLADTARVHLLTAGRAALLGSAPDGAQLHGWTFAADDATVWTATAPPPPGSEGRLPLVLLRYRAMSGVFRSVWSWNDSVTSVEREGDTLVVTRRDGSSHRHRRVSSGWTVEMPGRIVVLPALSAAEGSNGTVEMPDSVVVLSEAKDLHFGDANFTYDGTYAPVPVPPSALHTLPATFELGEPHYRRSELTWRDAGAPRATVTVTQPTPGTVLIEVDVPISQRLFIPITAENMLDNEPASINGDSIQLFAIAGARTAGLLLVPDSNSVSARQVEGWTNDISVDSSWRPTSTGYRLAATLHIGGAREFALDVIVNEAVAGRARRRGQLVLSGAVGEFVYLRGDRNDPSRLVRFSLAND